MTAPSKRERDDWRYAVGFHMILRAIRESPLLQNRAVNGHLSSARFKNILRECEISFLIAVAGIALAFFDFFFKNFFGENILYFRLDSAL